MAIPLIVAREGGSNKTNKQTDCVVATCGQLCILERVLLCGPPRDPPDASLPAAPRQRVRDRGAVERTDGHAAVHRQVDQLDQ